MEETRAILVQRDSGIVRNDSCFKHWQDVRHSNYMFMYAVTYLLTYLLTYMLAYYDQSTIKSLGHVQEGKGEEQYNKLNMKDDGAKEVSDSSSQTCLLLLKTFFNKIFFSLRG